jgi:hypothetical protein
MIRPTAAIFCATALVLLTVGCSRLTQENYEKLKPGMSYDEVAKILGRPEKCSEVLGIQNCSWGDQQRGISASFVGGKAVLYASQNIR